MSPAPSPARALAAVRRHLHRVGLGVAVVGGLGLAAGIFLLAWLLVGPGWAPGSPAPLLLVAVGLLLLAAGGGLLVRFLRRWGSEEWLTREVEREAGLPRGALRAQLELDREVPEGVSRALIQAGSVTLLARMSGPPERLAGRPGQGLRRLLRTLGGVGGVLALLAAGALFLAPERSRAAAMGLLEPTAILAGPVLPPLELRGPEGPIARGEGPEVTISAPQRVQVTLHWQLRGEPAERTTVEVTEGLGAFELPALDAGVRVWATAADGARSSELMLEPADALLLTDLTVELEFPAYMDRASERLLGLPSELEIPVGTRVTLEGRISGEGGDLHLVDEAGEVAVRLDQVGEGEVAGAWRPARSGFLSWEARGGEVDPLRLPPDVQVRLVEDAPPTVALPRPGSDTELPASLRLPILLEATDDVGLARVELWVAPVAADGQVGEPEVQVLPLEGQREFRVAPTLELAGRIPSGGGEILLWARAVDVSPAGQESVTPRYRLRAPSAGSVRDEVRRRIEEAEDRVERLVTQSGREARRLREQAADARVGQSGSGGDFQEREALREGARGQEALGAEVDAVREELAEARRSLDALGEPDGGLSERIAALEELLAELGAGEEAQRLSELMESLESGRRMDAAEELGRMADAREALQDNLEAVLERFRRAALEESFLGAEEDLRTLAEEQEELARILAGENGRDDAGEPGATEPGTREHDAGSPDAESPEEQAGATDPVASQESLLAGVDPVRERLQDLERRLGREGEEAASQAAGEAGRQLEQAKEAMERAAEAARSGDSDGAAGEAGEAGEMAQRALDELEEARRDWMEAFEEALRATLRQGAEEALALARRQDDLRARMERAGRVERGELRSDEAALVQGVRNLANRLEAVNRQLPEVGRELARALGDALAAGERTVDQLGRSGLWGGGRFDEAAARTAEALNRAAVLALSGMEQVGQGGEGSAMEQLMEELEALAEAQEAANQQAQASSGEGSEEGQGASTMEEAASAQRDVADAARNLASGEAGEWSPGDLDEMAQEAEALAEALESGTLDRELIRRQEELLERFLDAGRMLERDGPTEEREGTPAGVVERPLIPSLDPDLLRDGRLAPPSPEELRHLTPAERRLVLEYFEALNRSTSPGDGNGGQP